MHVTKHLPGACPLMVLAQGEAVSVVWGMGISLPNCLGPKIPRRARKKSIMFEKFIGSEKKLEIPRNF